MPVLSPLDLPHATLRDLLAGGAPVYLPVNPVEYHGPHLSLHNDALISRGLIDHLHAALAPDMPLLLVPDLEVGVDPVEGPGSRPVPYSTVRALVLRACRSLAELGARKVVLMTFHGAPLHNAALQAGVELLGSMGVAALSPMGGLLSELMAPSAELRQHMRSLCDTIADADDRQTMADAMERDFHAGFLETSLTLFLAPDSALADRSALPPCPDAASSRPVLALASLAAMLGREQLAAELRFAAWGIGWYGIRPHPGYTGRPDLANAEAGRMATELIVTEYVKQCHAVFAGGAAPEPPLRWLRWLTLGGRMPAPGIGN